MIGVLVTTYNRLEALKRSMPQIKALGSPVLVVDDGSKEEDQEGPPDNRWMCDAIWNVDYLRIPQNRGLAAALNIGLSYWLADKSVEWISYFQDDVDVHPKTLKYMEALHSKSEILTGHDAGEHTSFEECQENGIQVKRKWSIRATHIHAHRDFWREFLPIPTNELGTPKRKGTGRGMGSNVDWWIVRDAPNSCQKTKRPVICVPGLVRTFSVQAEDSCWNNAQAPEPQLR